LIDAYDWLFFDITIPSPEYYFYQNWDKAMDLYMFSVAFYTSLFWKDKVARKISIIVFAMRGAGDIIFFTTGFQKILLFTPNIFETLFLFYLFYVKFSGKKILYSSTKIILLVLLVVTIPKMSHEYMLHVLRLQPWDLFSIGNFLNTTGVVKSYIDYIGWGIILHLLQIITLLILVSRINTHEKQS